jgi:translation initiation factor 6 (eIF-6)
MFWSKKNTSTPKFDAPTFKFKVFTDDELLKLRTTLGPEISIFEEMRTDFKNLLLADDLELFVNGGPMEKLEEEMKKVLLPKFKTTFINCMGSIRFIRLLNRNENKLDQERKTIEKVAIEVFKKAIQGDSDIISDIISTIETTPVSVPIKSSSDIGAIAFNGNRVALMISDGVFTGNDLELNKKQIAYTNDLKYASERIIAFFNIVGQISSLNETIPDKRSEIYNTFLGGK